ncbi:hypothetical protein SEA_SHEDLOCKHOLMES_77 [Mycobacterium phage ShedlockHolmes]|uniref:CDGP domain-containing protein n=1 Tax=Mycobacterium phage ShedlockHolmes TaxID=1647313 RepID=A0A0F6WF19_9CAUD|nr:hypothetical protein SEA_SHEDLOCKHOLMES_77 [Mycobacterium phage ShedlockHolmes]AKF15254.1 hypothetical protein SEA_SHEDLOCKHOLMES_77 [Mycobacterium phage ShedlockHolmes]
MSVRITGFKRAALLASFGAFAAAAVLHAPQASADPGHPECQTVPWGFLGSQKRSLCDSPVRADGSWDRERLVWVPAHNVPLRTTCSGSYSITCTTTGGYFVDTAIVTDETYPVTPDTVLPDEPGHLQ